uniref:Uncharacterized protein n=1 Tax=Siphoviridae sp. ct2D011 TaxID=2825314 RepID=A0A8S5V9B0_9CAUD|nr:MAG TPA: hypothetical protein [Siphoviridae sp. ct2D011]
MTIPPKDIIPVNAVVANNFIIINTLSFCLFLYFFNFFTYLL